MSGGHWEYQQWAVRNCLDAVTRDPEVRGRWPLSARALQNLSDALTDILHDMDWDLSGDTAVENDDVFDQQCVDKLLQALESFRKSDLKPPW